MPAVGAGASRSSHVMAPLGPWLFCRIPSTTCYDTDFHPEHHQLCLFQNIIAAGQAYPFPDASGHLQASQPQSQPKLMCIITIF